MSAVAALAAWARRIPWAVVLSILNIALTAFLLGYLCGRDGIP